MNIASIQGNMILIDRYYLYKFIKIPDSLKRTIMLSHFVLKSIVIRFTIII